MLLEIHNQRTTIDALKRCKLHIHNKWKHKAMEHTETKFSKFVDFMRLVSRESNDSVYDAALVYMYIRGLKFQQYCFRSIGNCIRSSGRESMSMCGLRVVYSKGMVLEHVLKSRGNCLLPGNYANQCHKLSICPVPGRGQKHTKFLNIEMRDTGMISSNESDQPRVTNGLLQCAAMA